MCPPRSQDVVWFPNRSFQCNLIDHCDGSVTMNAWIMFIFVGKGTVYNAANVARPAAAARTRIVGALHPNASSEERTHVSILSERERLKVKQGGGLGKTKQRTVL